MEVLAILDYRLKTFITLAQVLNYTNTAKILNITQPTVSQHIRHLEDHYNTKLFLYKNKALSLTLDGQALFEYAIAMKTSADKIKEQLTLKTNLNPSLRFGTTLTIGEYTMRKILKDTLKVFPFLNLSMNVSNTENLLHQLKEGLIDFAILEGHFDKSKIAHFPFKDVDFIAICAENHLFSNKEIEFKDILTEHIILREEGSGTRNIFEQLLYEKNYSLDSLKHFIEIGNMKVIKELVKDNFGISFLYKESVEQELDKGTLKKIKIKNFNIKREFNFVYLKGSLHEKEYIDWFQYFIKKA